METRLCVNLDLCTDAPLRDVRIGMKVVLCSFLTSGGGGTISGLAQPSPRRALCRPLGDGCIFPADNSENSQPGVPGAGNGH